MMPVALPRSLFARNIALLIFLVVVSQASSLSVLIHYVQRPRVERAAATFAIYVQALDELLRAMAGRLMAIPEIAGVYYDLTHKPPGTIEWE